MSDRHYIHLSYSPGYMAAVIFDNSFIFKIFQTVILIILSHESVSQVE